MQNIQNVVSPFPRSYAELSQGLPKPVDEFLAAESETFDQVHERPHVRQQGRVHQSRLVQHQPVQSQGGRHRQFVRHWLADGGPLRAGVLRRRAVCGTGAGRAAGVLTPLLFLPLGRAIVGGTPLVGRLPAMMLSATKRTTQYLAPFVPGIREKADAAVSARNDAPLQFGMGPEDGVQRDQILSNQRPGAVVLVPICPEREELPGGDDKKAKLWVTMEMFSHTPSSYLTEADASRGRARFFCVTKTDAGKQPEPSPQSGSTAQPIPSLRCRRLAVPEIHNRLLGKKKPLPLSK